MDAVRQRNRRTESAWFYIAGFVLGGLLHLADRLIVNYMNGAPRADSKTLALLSTVLFTLNLSVYFLMIVRWFLSVRFRLLPSRGRTYLSVSCFMMIFFLLDRAVKYRIAASGSVFEHITWYLFYIPLAVMPTVFILTCLGAEPESRAKKRARVLVSLFCVLLIAAVVTNDLHELMFRPTGDPAVESLWRHYSNGPVWYVFYGYIALCVIVGTVLLAVTDKRKNNGRRALPSVLILIIMFVMMTAVDKLLPYSLWMFPEIAVFCMLGILENCIKSRLIPSNENYGLFFEKISFPALITDLDLKPVFRTAAGGSIPRDRLSDAADDHADLSDGKMLYGRRLSSGYTFFISDEAALRVLNEKLADVSDALEGENDMLRYENRQEEERARIDVRNAVYARASKEVYDVQKRISVCLRRAEDGADYRKNVAKALLLNAYVKRKTNFVLISSERRDFSAEELFSALSESARFLSLCGVQTGVERETDRQFSYEEVCALYDTFEMLIEALPEDAAALSVALGDGCLRMLTDCAEFAIPDGTPADVSMLTEDGQIYLTVTAKGGAS